MPQQPPAQVNQIPCPSCGAANVPGARYCHQCGGGMVPAQCAKCSATLAPGARFCGGCGQPKS
ncbi:zinc ribbon domain-containing protein [Acidovorax sp. LjRoot66]|uniref:zinc ribbon domain-containing protein n=1 Tax=Acidovorax sp. LjRoot66 TaxID=3342334 RepID=UPI003F4F69B6